MSRGLLQALLCCAAHLLATPPLGAASPLDFSTCTSLCWALVASCLLLLTCVVAPQEPPPQPEGRASCIKKRRRAKGRGLWTLVGVGIRSYLSPKLANSTKRQKQREKGGLWVPVGLSHTGAVQVPGPRSDTPGVRQYGVYFRQLICVTLQLKPTIAGVRRRRKGYNTEFHSGRVRGGRDLAVRTMQNRRGLSYDGLSSLAPIVTDCGASSALDALPHRPSVIKCTYAYCRFELPRHRAGDVRFQASCSNSAQLPSRRGRDADSGARGGHRGRRRHRHRRWVASNHSVQCPLDTRKQHETYV